MRIGGIASGMDTEKMLNELMKAERVPLDKLKQKKQILEWQRDDYRTINSLMLSFQKDLINMKLSSSYRSRNVSSSDESKVIATATGSASQGSQVLSKVTKLAQAEVRLNKEKVYNNSIDVSQNLYSQSSSFKSGITWKEGAVLTESRQVDANSKTFILNDASNLKKMNDGITVDVDHLASWSVKVDGKAYKVVTDPNALDENSVLVKSDGSITFKNDIAKGSNISIVYIGEARSDKMTLGEDPTTMQLSQVGVGKMTSVVLTEEKSDGTKTTKTYSVSGNDIMDGSTIIGTIDKDTGEITFTSNVPKSVNDKDNPENNVTYSLEVKYDHKYSTFSIDSHTSKGPQHENFIITGSDSLNNVINKVNSSKVGVTMFYDSYTGQVSLTRQETGDFNKDTNTTINNEISYSGDFIENTLKFGTASSNAPSVVAQNATFTINGLMTERESNNFTINGVSFTLKDTFDAPVTIGVTNDTEKTVENIKGFVEKYNTLIATIQAKLDEKRNRNYQPLTEEEREGLSESQQEKWDKIAKAGHLRRDPILSNALSEMRMDFYGTVNNSEISSAFNQLAKIGITTSQNYLDGGKLEINEEKLKKALETDPESVESLFKGEDGIIHKLDNTVKKTMDNLKLKAGAEYSTNQQFTIGRELDNLDKQVDRFEDRLKQVEERYWRQFTAMEQAMQRANSQASYFTQAFGG